jgi:hypothetical protein
MGRIGVGINTGAAPTLFLMREQSRLLMAEISKI